MKASVMTKPTEPNPGQSALQLVMFEADAEADGESLTNTVQMLDVSPRWVFFVSEDEKEVTRKGVVVLEQIERIYERGNRQYRLVMSPARIKRKVTVQGDDGADIEKIVEMDVFPGTREQIVEEVVRQIAVRRGRLTIEDSDVLWIDCSIHEIRQELNRVKHGLNYEEVVEALKILAECKTEIHRLDGGKSVGEFIGSIFPQIAFSHASSNGRTRIQMHQVISKAIQNLDYIPVPYETLMRVRKGVTRWLIKSLSFDMKPGKPYMMRATQIARDSGMSQYARSRDAFQNITEAVKALKDEGIAADVQATKIKNGRTITDVEYVIHGSADFETMLRKAAERKQAAIRELRMHGFKGDGSDGFLKVAPAEAEEMRKRKQQGKLGHVKTARPSSGSLFD